MGHHHGHGSHGHSHGTSRDRSGKALIWALALNGAFLLVEAVAGWWADSLALLSDAAHMASDVAALAVALGAQRLARVQASRRYTFGLARAEVLGAFLNGLSLAVACGWIVWSGVDRLVRGLPEMAAWPVLLVGVAGLAVNLGSALALYGSSRDDLNVQAAMAHMLADALGSVAAIGAALLAMVGVRAADPVLSILIAILIGVGAWRILRDAGRVLLQLPPAGADVEKMAEALLATESVLGVHDLHVWTLDGQRPIVTAHLVVAEGGVVDSVVEAARTSLKHRCGVDHSTLQTERSAGPLPSCSLTSCGVGAVR